MFVLNMMLFCVMKIGVLLGAGEKMALEWIVLTYIVGAEAIILLLVTLPGFQVLRKGLISVARSALQPLLTVIPFCLFLLLDIYWKFENLQKCESSSDCTLQQMKYSKSTMKTQRNVILVLSALLFYWLLYTVTHLLVQIDVLSAQAERLKRLHSS